MVPLYLVNIGSGDGLVPDGTNYQVIYDDDSLFKDSREA